MDHTIRSQPSATGTRQRESSKPLPGAIARVLKAYEHRALDEELTRLITLHGKEAVRERAKELTKLKAGRKPEPDWKLLRPIIETDAELWLDGKHAELRKRTIYKIAQAFAAAVPGHNPTATHRRIAKKLAANRQLLIMMTAVGKSRADYPLAAHLRSLKALAECNHHQVWDDKLAMVAAEVEKYRERMGEPDPTLSFAAIEEANRNALAPLPGTLGGLFGMLATDGNALKALR